MKSRIKGDWPRARSTCRMSQNVPHMATLVNLHWPPNATYWWDDPRYAEDIAEEKREEQRKLLMEVRYEFEKIDGCWIADRIAWTAIKLAMKRATAKACE